MRIASQGPGSSARRVSRVISTRAPAAAKSLASMRRIADPSASHEGGTSGAFNSELQIFSGRTIDVPSCFISGRQDWGTYQRPGAFEAMQTEACTNMLGVHLVDGAGHWVQQEQPEEVSRLLLKFVAQVSAAT